LTAGYLTEYSGLRWSLYQMAEYINMITVSAVAATVFFGGWSLFGLGNNIPGLTIVFFLIKVAIFLFLFMWIRATLPRIRYDRLMRLGWTTLLPLAVLNIVLTAIVVAFGWPWWVNGLAGLVVIAAVLLYERQQVLRRQAELAAVEKALPASVRLVKFDRVAKETSTPAPEEVAQEAKA
jgi:NADH-quinone oxidoreductase subunit H